MKKQNRNRFRLKLFLVLAVVLLLAALFSRQLCLMIRIFRTSRKR